MSGLGRAGLQVWVTLLIIKMMLVVWLEGPGVWQSYGNEVV